jgi:hypothetical protein
MRLAFYVFSLTVCVASCSTSTPGVTAARSTCSAGPDYPPEDRFRVEDDDTQYASCVARCGWATPGPYTLKALPSGHCTVDGERCAMSVNYFCPPDGRLGRVDQMRCSCTSGSWDCVIAVPGGGTCGPVDAGASAETGASL